MRRRPLIEFGMCDMTLPGHRTFAVALPCTTVQLTVHMVLLPCICRKIKFITVPAVQVLVIDIYRT